MTVAKKMEREFGLIATDDRGFCDGRLLSGFVERCAFRAVRIEFPYGEDSCDATRVYVFDDGSALKVSNPGQAFYRAFVGVHHE